MGLDSEELGLLDLNSSGFVPKSISDFLTEISMINAIPMKLSKLNDFIYVLEEEMQKIDGFKRELPLCMLLLTDAIWKLKEEVLQLKRREVEPVVMEEFMPLGKGISVGENGSGKNLADSTDKKEWMSSAQIWTTPIQYENGFNTVKFQESLVLPQSRHQGRDDGIARWNPSDPKWSFKNKLGGAFVPFKKPHGRGVMKIEEKDDYPGDGLSLAMPTTEVGSVDWNSRGKNIVASNHRDGLSDGGSSSQPQSKKQRRCWSPELHQSFVKALFELGGPQAATPKQIREIMQVDGLTNDEVKSHLQKYRLYIRKLLPSSSSASPDYDWRSAEKCSHLRTQGIVHSGSPEGPLHAGGSAKGASVTGGDSMEEEDVKSESHNWKGRHQKPTECE